MREKPLSKGKGTGQALSCILSNNIELLVLFCKRAWAAPLALVQLRYHRIIVLWFHDTMVD